MPNEECPRCKQDSMTTTRGRTYADKGQPRKDCLTPGCGYAERAGMPAGTPANVRPKDVYTQQLAEEEYESYGEGARRDLFGD